MNLGSSKHLDEAQILGTLVDEDALAPEVREHLSVCSSCLAEKERLQRNLHTMGKLARSLAPSPAGFFSLEEARSFRRFTWNWRQGAAAGFALACVVAVLVGTFIPGSLRNEKASMFSQEMIEDDELMAEIRDLEQDALPPLYADMAESIDAEPGEESPDTEMPESDNLS